MQDHALRGPTKGSKAAIDITSERPRSDELKTTETFLRLKKQALTLIRLEYMRQDPSNLSAYLNLERAYWRAGERLEALNTFRRILELSPGHDEALQFLRGLGR